VEVQCPSLVPAARYSPGVMPVAVRKTRVKSDGLGQPHRMAMAAMGTVRFEPVRFEEGGAGGDQSLSRGRHPGRRPVGGRQVSGVEHGGQHDVLWVGAARWDGSWADLSARHGM